MVSQRARSAISDCLVSMEIHQDLTYSCNRVQSDDTSFGTHTGGYGVTRSAIIWNMKWMYCTNYLYIHVYLPSLTCIIHHEAVIGLARPERVIFCCNCSNVIDTRNCHDCPMFTKYLSKTSVKILSIKLLTDRIQFCNIYNSQRCQLKSHYIPDHIWNLV